MTQQSALCFFPTVVQASQHLHWCHTWPWQHSPAAGSPPCTSGQLGYYTWHWHLWLCSHVGGRRQSEEKRIISLQTVKSNSHKHQTSVTNLRAAVTGSGNFPENEEYRRSKVLYPRNISPTVQLCLLFQDAEIQEPTTSPSQGGVLLNHSMGQGLLGSS